MVKGMGILMPSLIIAGIELGGRWRGVDDGRWLPLAAAAGVFVLIVAPWAVARWRLDGWRSSTRCSSTTSSTAPPRCSRGTRARRYYYLYFLQKHHYDWLLAAARGASRACRSGGRGCGRSWPGRTGSLAVLMAVVVRRHVRAAQRRWRPSSGGISTRSTRSSRSAWRWVVVEAWQATTAHPRRAALVAASFVVALGVAEGKLAWHSYRLLDVNRSAQSLFLAQRAGDRGAAGLRRRLAARRSVRRADRRRALRHGGRRRCVSRHQPRRRSLAGPARSSTRGSCPLATTGPADAVSTGGIRRV